MSTASINRETVKWAADKTRALLSGAFKNNNYIDPGQVRHELRNQYGIYLSSEELFMMFSELVPTHLRIHVTCHGPSPYEIFAFYKPVDAPK